MRAIFLLFHQREKMSTYQATKTNQWDIARENARFMSGVYLWMTIGITLTAITSFYVSHTPALASLFIKNKFLFYGCLIAELLLVISLVSLVKKISSLMATAIFVFYSILNGLTLSLIFLLYTQSSIASAFILTAFSFAGLSLFGYTTKKDLGPIGSFCTMGVFGLIGFSLMSFFFPSLLGGASAMIYSIAGVVIFAGLTAYDTQKIKNSNIIGNEGSEEDKKETILGALTLYIDFINLFLFLLRLMGNRRR
jgi:hypothetical protein